MVFRLYIKIVIGVYVGFDEPKSLGKYETGSKAALPIFKKFIKKVIKKKDALPFKVPKNINLVQVDVETGKLPNVNTRITIYESFKENKNFTEVLEKLSNKDTFNLQNFDNKGEMLKFY